MKKEKAFTLVELMTVVAIVGIIMVTAVPYMRSFSSNSLSSSISNRLLIDIMYTRNEAVTRGVNVQMIPLDNLNFGNGPLVSGGAIGTVGVNWGLGWRIVVEPAGANEEVRSQSSFGPDAYVRSTGAAILDSNTAISFTPNGGAINRGQLTVVTAGCAGNNGHTISINAIGQVTTGELPCPTVYTEQ